MRWFSDRRSPSPPSDHAMVSSVAACCVRSGYALSMGMTQQFFDFLSLVTLTFDLWPLTLTFELGRDFCTIYLSAKFDRPTFSRSEVIARTNKRTNWQRNRRRWKRPPRSATLRRWVTSLSCRRWIVRRSASRPTCCKRRWALSMTQLAMVDVPCRKAACVLICSNFRPSIHPSIKFISDIVHSYKYK